MLQVKKQVSLEDVDEFKYIANGQGTKEIRSRTNLGRSAYSRQHSCLWSLLTFVAYKRQDRQGSDSFDSAVQLRDVACTSSRRKDVGDV